MTELNPSDVLTVFQIEWIEDIGGFWISHHRYVIAYMFDYEIVAQTLKEGEEIATTMPLEDVLGGPTQIYFTERLWPMMGKTIQ